jgi:TatA/E family protein of Tat protein translocase
MFGSLGVPELLLIFAVILIVFGPRRIPEIGRMLGKAMGEFRKATDDLKNTIDREVRLEELKQVGSTTMDSFNTPFESVSRTEPEMVDEPSSLPVVEEPAQPQFSTAPPLDDWTAEPETVVESSSLPVGEEEPAETSSTTRPLDDSKA